MSVIGFKHLPTEINRPTKLGSYIQSKDSRLLVVLAAGAHAVLVGCVSVLVSSWRPVVPVLA